MDRTVYQTPLVTRYATKEMLYIFSDENKFTKWREVWIGVAKAQKEMGLGITGEQIEEMERAKDDINYRVAEVKEREIKHDVLSHVFAYGQQCPKAKPIIHLGLTSCDVTDNAELMQIREGLEEVRKKLVNTIYLLDDFAGRYKDLVTLAFTHYQPAQPTTLGKRATLWCYDLIMDMGEVEDILRNFKGRGIKGATGTQASFLKLFNGDEEKVRKFERRVMEYLGFDGVYPVTGQTYPRKFDCKVLDALAGIAQSAHKFSTDVRLLQNRKEMEEPFGKKQKGSSAMPYKRNPMNSERLSSLSRHVMVLVNEALLTGALQWFERTLDDSAGRRIYIPEAFLGTDAILNLYMKIMENPVVYPKMIEKHLKEELPFMLTENILMEAVKRGGDRQEIHTLIRNHSMEAGRRVKEGLPNDLLERIAKDERILLNEKDIERLYQEALYGETPICGLAEKQVDDFRKNVSGPLLEEYKDLLGLKSDVRV